MLVPDGARLLHARRRASDDLDRPGHDVRDTDLLFHRRRAAASAPRRASQHRRRLCRDDPQLADQRKASEPLALPRLGGRLAFRVPLRVQLLHCATSRSSSMSSEPLAVRDALARTGRRRVPAHRTAARDDHPVRGGRQGLPALHAPQRSAEADAVRALGQVLQGALGPSRRDLSGRKGRVRRHHRAQRRRQDHTPADPLRDHHADARCDIDPRASRPDPGARCRLRSRADRPRERAHRGRHPRPEEGGGRPAHGFVWPPSPTSATSSTSR